MRKGEESFYYHHLFFTNLKFWEQILTSGTWWFKIYFYYFISLNFKRYIKVNTDLFLGFCISLITILHQGQRVYITFIDAWIGGRGGPVAKCGNARKREILCSAIKINCFLVCYWEWIMIWEMRLMGHGLSQSWMKDRKKLSKDLIKGGLLLPWKY